MKEEGRLESRGDGHNMRSEREREGGHSLIGIACFMASCQCSAAPAAARWRCTPTAPPSLPLASILGGMRERRGRQGRRRRRLCGAKEHTGMGEQGEESEG